MAIGRIRKIKESDRKKVVTIVPSEDLGKVLEIDPERAKKNIKMGYYDTMRVYKKLKGSRYYLTKTIDESEIVARLLALPSETLDAFSALISSDKSGYRVLFEEIVPMVVELLKIEKSFNYEQILVAFYEFLAEEAEIDRYELMDLHRLIEKVNAYYLFNVDQYENEMDEIVKVIISTLPYKSVSFFPHKLKRDFLFHIYYIVTKGLQSAGK
jgi:NTE family protein